MCDHKLIKSTGKKTKHVTWYCVYCDEVVEEIVIPHNERLMDSYKEIIDDRIEFTHVLNFK